MENGRQRLENNVSLPLNNYSNLRKIKIIVILRFFKKFVFFVLKKNISNEHGKQLSSLHLHSVSHVC